MFLCDKNMSRKKFSAFLSYDLKSEQGGAKHLFLLSYDETDKFINFSFKL